MNTSNVSSLPIFAKLTHAPSQHSAFFSQIIARVEGAFALPFSAFTVFTAVAVAVALSPGRSVRGSPRSPWSSSTNRRSPFVSAAWHAVAALVVVLWPGLVAIFCCRDLLKSVACRRWLARAVGYSVHSATTVRSPPWSTTKLPRHARRTTGPSRRGHLFTYRRRRSRAGVRLCAILAVLLGGGGIRSVLAAALTDATFKQATWGT